MLPEKLQSLANKFRCPACGHLPLQVADAQETLVCLSCEADYHLSGGCPILLTPEGLKTFDIELTSDTGTNMQVEYSMVGKPAKQSFLKSLLALARPPQVMYDYNPSLQEQHTLPIFDHAGEGTLILNVGGGPSRYSDHEITMNIRPFFNVDTVGDAHNIPFDDDTFDSIICNAVLEHVHDPQTVVSEMIRVLKPGGILYAEIPFIFFFHGYPSDYNRYTIEGMKRLFGALDQPQFGMTQGPVSALLQAANTVVDILAPKKPAIIRKGFNGLYRWLFFVFKYLDILLEHKHDAHKLASGFYVLGKKPGSTGPGT